MGARAVWARRDAVRARREAALDVEVVQHRRDPAGPRYDLCFRCGVVLSPATIDAGFDHCGCPVRESRIGDEHEGQS